MISTECPICGCKDKKLLFERDFSCMKGIMPFKRYTVFQCDKCGALYAGDIVESMPLSKYYDICSKYSNENYNITSGTQNRFNRIADLFESMIPKNSSILDIGCSEGFLLKTLRDRGYTDVSGIEPSTQCVNFARKQLHLNVIAGGLGDMEVLSGSRYDVIISEQVMEHIEAPIEAVQEMKGFLKAEGILCIGVPDVLTYQNDIDLFQQFSSEHVNYFSDGSIENLMRISGFDKVDIIESPDSRSLISFWKLLQVDTAEYEVVYDTEGSKAINNYLNVNKKYAGDLKKRADLYELNKAKYNVWGGRDIYCHAYTAWNNQSVLCSRSNRWEQELPGSYSIWKEDSKCRRSVQ